MNLVELRGRLEHLGLSLPDAAKPVANYIPAKKHGHAVYTSGQLPMRDGQLVATGRVGESISVEDAAEAAKLCALNALAAASHVAELTGVVRVGVFVNAGPDFRDHPKVANGASDLLGDIFGESGRHARAAVGCSSLPLDAAVEVEVLFAAA
ncbi:MAG: RidA family protein [Planctomycetota bacterium]